MGRLYEIEVVNFPKGPPRELLAALGAFRAKRRRGDFIVQQVYHLSGGMGDFALLTKKGILAPPEVHLRPGDTLLDILLPELGRDRSASLFVRCAQSRQCSLLLRRIKNAGGFNFLIMSVLTNTLYRMPSAASIRRVDCTRNPGQETYRTIFLDLTEADVRRFTRIVKGFQRGNGIQTFSRQALDYANVWLGAGEVRERVAFTPQSIRTRNKSGRWRSSFTLRNASLRELTRSPWELNDPLRAFYVWIGKRILKPSFRKRLAKRPITLLMNAGCLTNSRLHLCISSESGGMIVINGRRLPPMKARALFGSRTRLCHQKRLDQALSILRKHPGDELGARLYAIPEFKIRSGGVCARVPLKVGNKKNLSIEIKGRNYPVTAESLSRLRSRLWSEISAPVGLVYLAEAGLPPDEVLPLLQASLQRSRLAEIRASILLRQFCSAHSKQVRVLRKRPLSILVHGKLRDYEVSSEGGEVLVLTHPSGTPVCIHDRKESDCVTDRVISRVTALMNDDSLKGEIHTLDNVEAR